MFHVKDLSVFKNDLKELHIDLSEQAIQQFLDYYELLVEWNSFMNLTAITDFDDVLKKHFIDSLSFIKANDLIKKHSQYDFLNQQLVLSLDLLNYVMNLCKVFSEKYDNDILKLKISNRFNK